MAKSSSANLCTLLHIFAGLAHFLQVFLVLIFQTQSFVSALKKNRTSDFTASTLT